MKFRETTDTSWAVVFDAHVKANSRRFFRVAYDILRDGGAAEDACQQAYLNTWERRGDLKTPSAIKGWITRAVVNESLQAYHHRRKDRRVIAERSVDSSVIPDSSLSSGLPNVAEHSPDQEDLRAAILDAIQSLPELQRAIVVLRIMQGLSGSQTMEAVGCSSSEVSKQLHRGLDQLRILLAQWSFDAKD